MKKENLYHPFEVDFKELDHYPKTTTSNNFFELIFIADGTGVQFINDNKFNYRKGNLFLLTPTDTHSFEIITTTKFFFLRFNDHFLHINHAKDMVIVQRMKYILQNASHRPGCILKNKVDKPLITSLIEGILQELKNQQLYCNTVVNQIVSTIITIVARNIALKLPKSIKENTGEPVLDILHYIQENIFDPKKLKAANLSQHFNIAINYLGRYFKSQTGDSLQQYICMYKVRLIEMRLLHSDMRINEIVNELGFTDESHLNKTFKRYKGLSPTEFKKEFSQKGDN